MNKPTNVTIKTDSIMTIKAAAELAGVTRVTMYRWIKAGKVGTVTFGNILYAIRDDIERIKEKRENGL